MKRIAVVLLSVSFIVSCAPNQDVKPTSSPTDASILAAKAESEAWTKRHPSAADYSDSELIKLLIPPEALEKMAKAKVKFKSLDQQTIDDMRQKFQVADEVFDKEELWRVQNYEFGYLGTEGATSITDARLIQADQSLKGKKIKITLDSLRVEKYPGKKGTHSILFNVHGQTQSGNEIIPLSYSLGVEARDGDVPLVMGKGIFVGLEVGSEGVDLKGQTINIKNIEDKTLFNIIKGTVFGRGMRLLNSVASSFQPLCEVVEGITADLSKRYDGQNVQSFEIGLDFTKVQSHAKLREGTYIIVQIPPSHPKLNWDNWEFASGGIVKKGGKLEPLPYNCIVLGVSKIESDKAENI